MNSATQRWLKQERAGNVANFVALITFCTNYGADYDATDPTWLARFEFRFSPLNFRIEH